MKVYRSSDRILQQLLKYEIMHMPYTLSARINYNPSVCPSLQSRVGRKVQRQSHQLGLDARPLACIYQHQHLLSSVASKDPKQLSEGQDRLPLKKVALNLLGGATPQVLDRLVCGTRKTLAWQSASGGGHLLILLLLLLLPSRRRG